MLNIISLLLILLSSLTAMAEETSKLVVETKQIVLEDFPNAWNPSMIKIDEGFLMTFRYTPNPEDQSWLSYIGIVVLDERFEPISKPQLLTTRLKNSLTPSQSEDARIFRLQDRIFLIYNDNVDNFNPSRSERRDMFMAELLHRDGHFSLSSPLKLIYEEKYHTQLWQKNWVPFEKEGSLLLSYSLNPHEVLYPNPKTGICYSCYETLADLNWAYGIMRGSTPALLIDGEYLAFFHAGIITASPASWGLELWHYFMGAYTFSAEPPFELTKITPQPIMDESFYTPSDFYKRVIFPGGFVVSGSLIYVAYGKDDREIWIATLDKEVLKKTLQPVVKHSE